MKAKQEERRLFQLDLNLPTLVPKDAHLPTFEQLCNEAQAFLHDTAFINCIRIVKDEGSEAIQDEVIREKFQLALDIQWGVVRLGKHGWERFSEPPTEA